MYHYNFVSFVSGFVKCDVKHAWRNCDFPTKFIYIIYNHTVVVIIPDENECQQTTKPCGQLKYNTCFKNCINDTHYHCEMFVATVCKN